MDTIDLGVTNRFAVEYMRNFISKNGVLSVPQDPETGKIFKKIKGYRCVMSTTLGGYTAIMGYDNYLPNVPPACLIFHCSQFPSYSVMRGWLEPIFGPYVTDLSEAIIRRIDLCVDLSLGIETLARSVRLPKVQTILRQKSASGRGTIYFGSGNKKLVIYEKSVPGDALDDCASGDPEINVWGTRVEIRLKGDHRPIKRFGDIEKLKLLNPFSEVKVEALKDVIPNDLDPRIKQKLLAYRQLESTIGAAMARHELNRDGNFDRTVGKYLIKTDLDLYAAWRRRVKRFFGEEAEAVCVPPWRSDIPFPDDFNYMPNVDIPSPPELPWH